VVGKPQLSRESRRVACLTVSEVKGLYSMSQSQNRNLVRKLLFLLILALFLVGAATGPSSRPVKAKALLPPCSMCSGPNQPMSCPNCIPDCSYPNCPHDW
jgi:hypothetical protein